MSKVEKNREERNEGLIMLKLTYEKLQRSLSFSQWRRLDFNDVGCDAEREVTIPVPEDVKGGHFAVLAVKGGERRRLVIEFGYLTNPAFLHLLEQVKEEYGYEQKGALAVPCQPEDLQKILEI